MSKLTLLVVQLLLIRPYFGQSDRNYIVGGTNAKIEGLPHLVSLHADGTFFCGGSLIHNDLVLSAAHCFPENSYVDVIAVRAGSNFLDRGGQVAQVIHGCRHPKYDSQTVDYDVIVLRLDRQLVYGPMVQPIQLPYPNMRIPDGLFGVVAGWGALDERSAANGRLQVVVVPKLNQELCSRQLSNFTLTPRMTCYGYLHGGKDACFGDSGGSLVVNDVLIGVISWGDGCAAPMKPGVYTDLTNPEIINHVYECLAAIRD